MANYLRPRRGKRTTAEAKLTSSNPLKRGEIFFEVPDAGIGTGAGKIKMGDGTTGYTELPYFLESGSGGGGIGTDVTLILPVANWVTETISGTQYWTQTVTCAGAAVSTVPIIVPIYTTDAQIEAYSNIIQANAGNNNIKFTAIAKPNVELTVVAKFAVETSVDLDNLNEIVTEVQESVFTGTTAEVNAAIQAGDIADGAIVNITDDYDNFTANEILFDNTGTGMSATTVQGAITELNNDLTKKSLVNTYYDDSVNKLYKVNADGSKGSEIKMGGLPTLNYTTPLWTPSAGNTSYTATKECYITGSLQGTNAWMKINNVTYFTNNSDIRQFVIIKLSAGDTVSLSWAMPDIHVCEEA